MLTEDRSVDKLLKNVVHDIRQPLGNIETSAYLLSLMLRDSDPAVLEHLTLIERQLDKASRILSDATSELSRLRDHRTVEVSLDFTNSETAVVT
jgi:signal transduction histidine kinase